MRIVEVVSAEEMMVLWRMITTSIWDQLDQQRKFEADRINQQKAAISRGKRKVLPTNQTVQPAMQQKPQANPAPTAMPPAGQSKPHVPEIPAVIKDRRIGLSSKLF